MAKKIPANIEKFVKRKAVTGSFLAQGDIYGMSEVLSRSVDHEVIYCIPVAQWGDANEIEVFTQSDMDAVEAEKAAALEVKKEAERVKDSQTFLRAEIVKVIDTVMASKLSGLKTEILAELGSHGKGK